MPDVIFPEARALVMKLARTFWEKATAAHVYCRQAKLRGERFSRHWFDLAAISGTPQFAAALGDRAVAAAVAEHKSWFFVEKDASGAEIDYRDAVGSNLQIVPTGAARDALDEDYGKMTEGGILQSVPTFDELMRACRDIEACANEVARG